MKLQEQKDKITPQKSRGQEISKLRTQIIKIVQKQRSNETESWFFKKNQ